VTERPPSPQVPGTVSTAPEPPTDLPHRFRQLFLDEFDFICRSLRRLGVREADVHDVAQELFLAVYRLWPQYDPARSAHAWLFGFAIRLAANYRRLGWHRGSALTENVPAAGMCTEDALSARQMVSRGLEALNLEKRVVLIMHDLEQIPAPEIAFELGVPVNTVYSRLRLARESFRAAIDQEAAHG
jgi:RNA polymerase sigma-70 factor (ECF subfamily)